MNTFCCSCTTNACVSAALVAAAGVLQALEKANGIVENITWELFKETLLEQAEQVTAHLILAPHHFPIPAAHRSP